MRKIISLTYKAVSKIYRTIFNLSDAWRAHFLLYVNNVESGDFVTSGIPYVSIARGGRCVIGKNFKMNNNLAGNPIGRPQRCVFFVDRGAVLSIGDNVSISGTALVAHQSITIGNNVMIGGGACIYDTDFHSLAPQGRKDHALDMRGKVKKAVVIRENAFIGAHATLLKGVTVGENAIVGACSVVTKDIPDNEIWAGNPAHFIKKVIPNE